MQKEETKNTIWVTLNELKSLIKEMHIKQLQESSDEVCEDCGNLIEECEC